MNKTVKWVLLGIIAAAGIAGGIYYSNMPLKTALTAISPTVAELSFTEQGVVVAKRVVDIYALTGGEILELNAAEGERINKGDVIFSVDASDYALQIKQIESNIKGYEAQINNLALDEKRQKDSLISNKNSLLGQLASLEAQEKVSYTSTGEQIRARDEQIRLQNIVIEQARDEVTRAEESRAKAEVLFKGGTLPQNDYNAAVKALENAQSALKQSEQQLEIIAKADVADVAAQFAGQKESLRAQIAGIDSAIKESYAGAMQQYYEALIEGCKVSIEQLSKKIIEASIVSPVSGTILTLAIKNTNTVVPGAPVASIIADSTSLVEVYVSTKDIDVMEPGKEVQLIMEKRAGDETFSGKVLYAEEEAITKISALGVEERRVKVTIEPEDGANFKPGYDVDVRIVYYREENKLMAPKTALFIENDKDMVWVIRDGKARKTEVLKGIELRSDVVIESGLQTGDMVVTDASLTEIKEGGKVTGE